MTATTDVDPNGLLDDLLALARNALELVEEQEHEIERLRDLGAVSEEVGDE